jgi:hypothetical protein
MQLNIYALAKIAIMTDSLHASCEWSRRKGGGGEALRRNVDVRRVNMRGWMDECMYEVCRLCRSGLSGLRCAGEARSYILHRLRDAESSSTQDSLLLPLPFPLSSLS